MLNESNELEDIIKTDTLPACYYQWVSGVSNENAETQY